MTNPMSVNKEEIRKALNQEIPVEWHKSAPTWLRSLLDELAEKDKVLSFYADDLTYDIDHLSKHGYIIIDKDAGEQARSILSQYQKE